MTINLRYTEVEDDLRAAVRELLADRSPIGEVLARVDQGDPYDMALWRRLAVDMGCAGLAVPVERGGAGAGLREVAVVLEELGRALAPVPFLGSAVLATSALLACTGDDAGLLTGLAGGTRTAALVLPFSTPPPGHGGAATYPVVASGDTLTGTVTSVADALPADVLLVPTAAGLFTVDAADPAVRRTALVSLDATRTLCDIRFGGATGRLLADAGAGSRAVATALTTGAALLASEQLGVAEACLESTVEYVKQRYQFGRPVGSFQALKHRLAEVWVQVSQARSVARYAVATVAAGDADAPIAAALAQAYCSGVAVHAAEEAVQMHGGIGFTWEHPVHLYLKRAKSAAIALGTPDRHRDTLATLVDLPAAPA